MRAARPRPGRAHRPPPAAARLTKASRRCPPLLLRCAGPSTAPRTPHPPRPSAPLAMSRRAFHCCHACRCQLAQGARPAGCRCSWLSGPAGHLLRRGARPWRWTLACLPAGQPPHPRPSSRPSLPRATSAWRLPPRLARRALAAPCAALACPPWRWPLPRPDGRGARSAACDASRRGPCPPQGSNASRARRPSALACPEMGAVALASWPMLRSLAAHAAAAAAVEGCRAPPCYVYGRTSVGSAGGRMSASAQRRPQRRRRGAQVCMWLGVCFVFARNEQLSG